MIKGSATSFLDVLACALGGATMLFLILSLLPKFGAPSTPNPQALGASERPDVVIRAGKPADNPPELIEIRHDDPACALSLVVASPSVVLSKRVSSDGVYHLLRVWDTGGVRRHVEIELTNCNGEVSLIAIMSPRTLKEPSSVVLPNAKGRLIGSPEDWKLNPI